VRVTTRVALHDLVDNLPEDLLSEAEDSLGRLASERARRERPWKLHDEAPLEDEELSQPEIDALRRLAAGESNPALLTEAQMEALLFGAERA
jgi:hypothetical protein